MMKWDDSLSRERLAGYDPARLGAASVLLVGAGAAGNNVALTLALSGLGELRVVDFDHVEPSNLSRAPLFRRERLGGGRQRHKAREVAQGFLAHAMAPDPVARFATVPFEALGLGAFRGVDVVVSAVDSFRGRALLSDAARRCGIPFVECGFSAPRGHVSVFSNQRADGPCWRCLMPGATAGGASCTLYARAAAAEGRIAATQSVAAMFGAMAAEAALLALHGEFPLGDRMCDLDVRTGHAHVLEVVVEPGCGGHTALPEVVEVEVADSAPLSALFDVAERLVSRPIVHLPTPLLLRAPCALCGAGVTLGKPVWAVREPPQCRACPKVPQLSGQGVVTQGTVTRDDELASRACKALGIAPGAIVVVEDGSDSRAVALRIAGTVDDLFTTRRRSPTPEAATPEGDPG